MATESAQRREGIVDIERGVAQQTLLRRVEEGWRGALKRRKGRWQICADVARRRVPPVRDAEREHARHDTRRAASKRVHCDITVCSDVYRYHEQR